MTDRTLTDSLETQEKVIEQLNRIVTLLEDRLYPVLYPDLGEDKANAEELDSLPVCSMVLSLNSNNERINQLTARLYTLEDRLALGGGEKKNTQVKEY